MKKIVSVVLLLALAGCAPYTLVRQGPKRIGDYLFTLDQNWNKAPAPAIHTYVPGTQVWTEDGLRLDDMVFWPTIRPGRTLFRSSKAYSFPRYTSGMLPTDIENWVKSSLVKWSGAGKVIMKTRDLRPVTVAGRTAFEFELHSVNGYDLQYSGDVIVIPRKRGVSILMFRATSIHYYHALLPDWKEVVRSLHLRRG